MSNDNRLQQASAGQLPANKLTLRYLPVENSVAQESAPSILLLHGFAASSAIWRNCIDSLRQQFNIYLLDLPGHGFNADTEFSSLDKFIDQFAEQLLTKLPPAFSVIGWSLGGVVASLIAERYSSRVCCLITIATNQLFIGSKQWPSAMASAEFNQFVERLGQSDAEADLNKQSVLQRFYILQTCGAAKSSQDLRAIKRLLADEIFTGSGLRQALHDLSAYDLTECWSGLAMPVMHQYGANDQLVPRNASVDIAARHTKHSVKVFDNSAHLPFVSERENWLTCTTEFIYKHTINTIDKNNIALSFSKAADTYDTVAEFQHKTGERLLSFLPDHSVSRVLDLGVGTGYFSSSLRGSYPAARMVELDISARMLELCKHRSVESHDLQRTQVQADIEALPFHAQCFDLIFSNLSIQWCHDLDNVFYGIANNLADDGTAILTTLVDGSLHELKQAWSTVDDAVHVNAFTSEQTVQASCLRAGLSVSQWLVEDNTQSFATMAELIRSVKDVGAHNMHPGRPKGLMGKNKYRRFINAYEQLQLPTGQFPLSYRVLYMVLRR